MTMTYSSKDPTENTPPLLSGENIEASAPPSAPSAKTDNTQTSTTTTPKSSKPTRKDAPTGERLRQHADLFRVTVKLLEKRGLMKRYKVLSKDEVDKAGNPKVAEIRLVLSPAVWTDDLHLRLLSDGVTTVAESVLSDGNS